MTAVGVQTVLVVDDSVDIHRLVAAALRRDGVDLIGAMSADDGVRHARERRPDLILLDVDMPDRDGFEACRLLKDDGRTRDVPIVFLTGNDDVAIKVRGFSLGAVDYIVKPWHPDELRARVRAALRTRQLQVLLAERAHTDALTGLRNRSYFDERLAQELERAARYGRCVSLLLLDVDHFKDVNDTYGHLAGDEVLRGLGRILGANARVVDAACRYGGEEFALILPECDLPGAVCVAERLREEVHRMRVPGVPPVTVSVGAACAWAGVASDVVGAADAALYGAKGTGRNRVVAADAHRAA